MEKGGGGGGGASSRADATSSFTVFVSPPWSVPSSIKHVSFSEAFPAIGGLGVGGGRRVRMSLSRSLESIPENAVWHAGKGGSVGAAGAGVTSGGAASRDASATVRGALLPPIRQTAAAIAGGDLDLPEMRARAFSDPNAYQTASTRERHQHAAAISNAVASGHPIRATETGGGLAKVGAPSATAATSASAASAAPRPPATPPKKPPSPKPTRKAAAQATLAAAKRSQHESTGGSDDVDSPPVAVSSAAGGQSPSKDRAEVRLVGGGGGPKAAIATDRVLNALADAAAPAAATATQRHASAAAAAAAAATAGHSSQPSAAVSHLKAGGGSGVAATSGHTTVTAAAAGNGARGRMSTAAAAAAGELPSPPPLAAAQRNHNKAAAGGAAVGFFDAPTGVQPRIVHPPNIDRGGRGQLNSRHARHADKEVDTSRTAFALVGSPGRKRWPSPHREATSFISATPQGRPLASTSAAAATTAAASFGGSHSYSGPMSPLAAAAAREDAVGSGSGSSSVGGSEESLNWSGGGDAGRWCSAAAASVKTPGAIDIPSAAAAGAASAGACSKEFQAILSGFIASGSAASAAAIGREGAYGRDGRQAPDDMLAETRAHFLRAGCRPISDSL